MKIFLAEDNEDNYLIIKSNLRKVQEDVELIWAKDGKEAMMLLDNIEDVSLFLLDIEMPFIKGNKIAKWIRTKERFNNVPIVAVTASVFAEMKKIYLEEGFDAILEKPFSRKEFLGIIEEVCHIS
ncbi:response regulator [Sulfurimonas microaerophilic]|uniref:response regulator n=1 Tax=Sulfurimonas microaerophilic TaxID=3058392 RepID=UPI002714D8AD|nr:response regulator [Sulfurimonas sp. hsl 1-7]